VVIFAFVTNLVKVLLLFERFVSPGRRVHPIVILCIYVLYHPFASFLRLQILSFWSSCRVYFSVELSGVRGLGRWSRSTAHIILHSKRLNLIGSKFSSVGEIVPSFAELLNPLKFGTSTAGHELIKLFLCLHLEESLLLDTLK
jgi:hypothetical protein